MTVRVTVKTHGCPASVTVQGQEPVTVDHHSQRTFDVDGEASLSICEEAPSAEHGAVENARPFEGEEVPGRRQNDELLGNASDPGNAGRTGEHPAPQTGRGRQPLKGEPPAEGSAQ